MNRRTLTVLLVLVLLPTLAFSQDNAKSKTKAKAKARAKAAAAPKRPTPTAADVVYGTDSPRQKFDFWQAESDEPTPLVLLIHGGGWRGGDKTGYGANVIQPFLDAGISVAAINYRFIEQAMEQGVEPPVKAPLHDAARALQTLRSKAKEWNLDPKRVGATGGSAGACTSVWLALHDDLADIRAATPSRSNRRVSPARRWAEPKLRSIPSNCASGFPTRSTAATRSVSPRRAADDRRSSSC